MPSGRVKKSVKPKTKVERPIAPGYLDALAKSEYAALVEVLEESGKLASSDPKLIELYAINYSLLVRASIELNKQPLSFGVDEGKRPFINPLIAVVHNATQKIRQVIADFALSPVTAKLVESRLASIDPKWEGLF